MKSIVKRSRIVLVLALAVAVTLIPLCVSAASDPAEGSNAAYNSTEIDGSNEHVQFRLNAYPQYKGICCQYSIPPTSSGTATVSYQGSNTAYAKAIYYFGLQLGWANSIGTASGNNAFKLTCILQDLSGSLDYVINHPSQYTEQAYEQAVEHKQISTNCRNSYPAWDDNPARGITVIFGNAGTNSQNFIAWKNNPVGYVKLSKRSADTSITG